jgi:hypothetical protein
MQHGFVESAVPGCLRRLGAVDMQDLDRRRCGQHLAEGVHPVSGLLARPDAAVAELVELIELLQFDLELQRGTVAMAAGQRVVAGKPARPTPAFGGCCIPPKPCFPCRAESAIPAVDGKP